MKGGSQNSQNCNLISFYFPHVKTPAGDPERGIHGSSAAAAGAGNPPISTNDQATRPPTAWQPWQPRQDTA